MLVIVSISGLYPTILVNAGICWRLLVKFCFFWLVIMGMFYKKQLYPRHSKSIEWLERYIALLLYGSSVVNITRSHPNFGVAGSW